MDFLPDRDPRPLAQTPGCPFTPVGLYLGEGAMALEVAAYTSPRRPTVPELREIHASRLGKRATPVVIAVQWSEDRAAICGPAGGEFIVEPDADRSQVKRICDAALAAADRHAAIRFLGHALGQLGAPIPGLRTFGLFAMHHLEVGVPGRADWAKAGERAADILGLRREALIEGLGFSIQATQRPIAVLVARETKVAIALFLERPDEIDPPNKHFDNLSPISFALAQADHENLDYVVVSAGSTLRIYPVKPSVGTARRGRTETFVELNLDLLPRTQAAYLWLLTSAEALGREGSFTGILAESEDYAADLGARLRDRVYNEVVPGLAEALVKARRLRRPTAEKLRETYEMALLVVFRLLFVAYAEDKELLPLHTNPSYTKHSLKEIAKRLQGMVEKGQPFEDQDFLWNEVQQLWKAVERGNKGWGVPEYDGGLFATDEETSPTGAALVALSLPDSDFGPALAALLLDETAEGGRGPIDFRTLGVREFGTIYEGLLESELSLAETDLAVDPKTVAYVPAKGRAKVEVAEGRVYLHNRSGARKASGAYYTKSFAVEHLLERALEPALKDHFARLDALYDDRDAAERFFDFRVADIAMGSGHFLVAAVDHVERGFSNYLARRPLAGVTDELGRLRRVAEESLGEDWAGEPIEDSQLLRRQIARRCIFGVDLNPLAVELARLSIWIHTFVPGLPLSFLDHNLVVGNSLVGIATLEEAAELMGEGTQDLFVESGLKRLERAREPIQRLARLADASAAEVKEAKRLYAQMRREIRSEEALLTILAASRTEPELAAAVQVGNVATRLEKLGDPLSDSLVRRAEKALDGLHPFHFPIAFAQVFLGQRAGFDVIVGNPPWEKTQVEEHEFWSRHYPGFKGVSQTEREREVPKLRRSRPDLAAAFEREQASAERLRLVLMTGPYPGMGKGHPDLYKAFCWRFWHLVARDGGRIGVVLPRSALAAKGSTEFRLEVFKGSRAVDVTMLLNNKTWVFPEVHPQYTIGLVSIVRGFVKDGAIRLQGPYASLTRFTAGIVKDAPVFRLSEPLKWNESASLPLLPSENSAAVFAKLRKAPRLDLNQPDTWRARPLQGDLNSTTGKDLMSFREARPEGHWAVYKGESFNLWEPDTGAYYAWANPKVVVPTLQAKRTHSRASSDSPFAEFPGAWLSDAETLPCLHPRIAFRRIARATDTRTVIAALVPPEVVLVDTAPYFLWPRGNPPDEAYLLGMLSSRVLDWYARRFVETHVDFYVLNPFPVPRPRADHPLRLRVIELAGRLAAQDRRFTRWAKALDLKPNRLANDEQDDLIAELDAAVAHLYGLAEADLVHIFETFHEGWEYHDRLDRTLGHFRDLKRLA